MTEGDHFLAWLAAQDFADAVTEVGSFGRAFELWWKFEHWRNL